MSFLDRPWAFWYTVMYTALMTIFGEPVSKMSGKVWDEIDAAGTEVTKAAEGNSLTVASQADQDAYAEIAKPIHAKVIADVAAKGVDARAAVDFIAKEMAGY